MSFCELFSNTKNRSDVENHVAHGIYELLHFKRYLWYIVHTQKLKKTKKLTSNSQARVP